MKHLFTAKLFDSDESATGQLIQINDMAFLISVYPKSLVEEVIKPDRINTEFVYRVTISSNVGMVRVDPKTITRHFE